MDKRAKPEPEPIEREEMFDKEVIFEDMNLSSEILKSIKALKYTHPTTIQR